LIEVAVFLQQGLYYLASLLSSLGPSLTSLWGAPHRQ